MDADEQIKYQQSARFYQLLEHLKISQVALSKETGILQSTISAITLGRRELNKNSLNALKKYLPNLNLNWLMWGEGEMFLENQAPIPAMVQEPEPVYNRDPFAALRQLLQDYGERIQQVEERLLILENNQQHDEQ